MKRCSTMLVLCALSCLLIAPSKARADSSCPAAAAAANAIDDNAARLTEHGGNEYTAVSNLYVACGIAKKSHGDKEGAASAGLQGAHAAHLAATTYRGAWGAEMINGNDSAALESAAKQEMRNAIHLAEDVARMKASASKDAANLAYSMRAELATWWPGD